MKEVHSKGRRKSRTIALSSGSIRAAAPVQVYEVTASEARQLQRSNGVTLLDVRPEHEHKRASLEQSIAKTIHVPLFCVEGVETPMRCFRSSVAFAFGGWWTGDPALVRNPSFERQVHAQVGSLHEPLLVLCQRGFRSLTACEMLALYGFTRVSWLSGGLEACDEGDLLAASGGDIRRAGEGGVSKLLGFSPFEQEELGTLPSIARFAVFALVLDVAIEYVLFHTND